MRISVLLLLISSVLSALGQTYVEAIDLGDSILTMAIYHVQADLDKHRVGKLEMYWNRADSANCYRAELNVPSWLEMDPNHPVVLRTRVYHRHHSKDSLVLEHKTTTTVPRSVSLRLKVKNGRAYLNAGSYLGGDPFEVPVDVLHPESFGASASDFLHSSRHTLIYAFQGRPPVYTGITREEILDYLRHSNDPLEGLWQHLDRDMPTRGIRLHHKYTLATIKDDENGYLLIDVGEDSQSLPLKGKMSPTIFHNNYNLVWYPVEGPVQDDDCYADISLEGKLLSIHIPVMRTTFRLSRVPLETQN